MVCMSKVWQQVLFVDDCAQQSAARLPDIESDTVTMVTSKSPNSTCPMMASISATHMTV